VAHLEWLQDLVVVVAVGVVASIALARLRLPSAAGLLLAGALVGPSGLGLVHSMESIHVLAEVGVVLLLFTIGLELSLERFVRIAKLVLIGGSLQVGLTGAAATLIAIQLGRPVGEAVFWGFVFALSSTAIVLRGLSERGELDAPHGRFIVGVLIFQDLCVVPMVLLVPVLGGGGEDGIAMPLLLALGKAVLVVGGTMLVARFLVPSFFRMVDAARSREVFVLSVLGICIGPAYLTSLAGLSLALGAFLGGLVVAGTQHGHRAMSEILPLRDAFTAFFFVSMGMLFDIRVVASDPVSVLLLALGFILGKAVIATLSAMAMRFPARVAMMSGLGLAQFGEFGFVLATVATGAGLVTAEALQPMLAAGLLSMFLTPVLRRLSPHITAGERLLRPLERLLGARGVDEIGEDDGAPSGHVIVVGYGMAGQILARALRQSDIEYVVLEINAETVRNAAKGGEPIYYADVSSPEALEHAHVEAARAVVMLINDPEAAKRAAAAVRRSAPDVPVLMRTRYLLDRAELEGLATNVVYDEVEAGVEMLARVLRRFDVPRNVIHERLDEVRTATASAARPTTVPRKRLGEARELDELKIEKVLVRDGDPAAGRSPRDLDLRNRSGALIVAVRRGEALHDPPDPDDPLEPGDEVYLVGATESVTDACAQLTARDREEEIRAPG